MIMIESWPDTEFYCVCYTWGTRGSFIGSLIYDFLFGSSNVPFSSTGEAHVRAELFKQNWNIEEEIKKIGHDYEFVDPRDPLKPMIMLQHLPPDLDVLFHRYPKTKLILISYTPSDESEIKSNINHKLGFGEKMRMTEYLDLEKYQGKAKNIYIIPYHDIMHNKKRTMMMLSKITNKPITPEIEYTYDLYIRAQPRYIS